MTNILAAIFNRGKQRRSSLIHHAGTGKRLRIEGLEDRRLLAITWINQFDPNNGFAAEYLADEAIARQLVNRAIADWNRVVVDQNWDNDNDPLTTPDFVLTVNALDLNGSRGGTGITSVTSNLPGLTPEVPVSATINMDDDGGGLVDSQGGAGDGWFFDSTPLDDIEFTSIAGTFQASFLDSTAFGQTHQNDFYRTIVHEIGHALGIYTSTNPLLDRLLAQTVDIGDDPNSTNPNDRLRQFNSATGPIVLTTNGGGHIFEGNHPNDLMNPGRTVPAGQPNPTPPIETTRQFISDLNIQLLADAYGYEVATPRAVNNAHVMLDSVTGTLLVQGRARNFTTGAGVNDTITIERVTDANGDDIRVTIQDADPLGNIVERVPFDRVRDIIIHGNGSTTTDSITVNPSVTQLWQQVDFVVSSNEDALEISTSVGGSSTTNGIVDLSSVIPGSQTTLRAAVIEANAAGAPRGIYVGRGTYNLTRTGSEGAVNAAVRDIDITGVLTIVGAGPGATVIDAGGATGLGDRHFEVRPNANLTLTDMTLTGGQTGVYADPNNSGGGALFVNGTTTTPLTRATVKRVAFVDNTAANAANTTLGGAILNSMGLLVIEDSVFTDNEAELNGGAVYSAGLSDSALSSQSSVYAKNTVGGVENNIGSTSGTSRTYGNNLATLNSAPVTMFNSDYGDTIITTPPTYVVTSLVDEIAGGSDPTVRSLREAVIAANTGGGTIWLPAWRHRLDLKGNEGSTNAQVNDIDVAANVAITGTGAGNAIIDAGGEHGLGDRLFEIRSGATLGLTGITATGGWTGRYSDPNTSSGGAVLLVGSGTLNVTRSAFTNNHAHAFATEAVRGGAIFSSSSAVNVSQSVFAGNSAPTAGGAIHVGGSALMVTTSVFAQNTAASNPNLSGSSITSNGYNRSDDTAGFTHVTDATGTVDYVVTSLRDTFEHYDDARSLSLREAVDLANLDDGIASGTTETIWLPAWNFVLTRERQAGAGSPDTDVAYGDLDITDGLTVRGISTSSDNLTKVRWRGGVSDAVFDLLGDYTGDGLVGGPDDGDVDGQDYSKWLQQFGSGDPIKVLNEFSADGDDDGDVDADDLTVWETYYGNALVLDDLDAILV